MRLILKGFKSLQKKKNIWNLLLVQIKKKKKNLKYYTYFMMAKQIIYRYNFRFK